MLSLSISFWFDQRVIGTWVALHVSGCISIIRYSKAYAVYPISSVMSSLANFVSSSYRRRYCCLRLHGGLHRAGLKFLNTLYGREIRWIWATNLTWLVEFSASNARRDSWYWCRMVLKLVYHSFMSRIVRGILDSSEDIPEAGRMSEDLKSWDQI